MPIPSRDRLSRPVDISTLYQGAARRVDLIVDRPGLRRKGLSGNGPGIFSGGSSNGRTIGVHVGQGWFFQQTVMARRYVGGQGRGIRFPSGYPRAPLRDITAIVRAVERRRAELNQTIETRQAVTNEEPLAASITELEQEIGSQTPLPTVSVKPRPSPATQIWKIKPNNAGQDETGSDFLTPQRRLLNSIDKVREIWLEDQKRLEQTPAAKRAERQKKIRTLMTMR